ncbi:MAG: transaldolase family protein [Candidatus Babeliales bacterium]
MKLFLDTADIEVIKKWAKTGIIDGVTTNPSHLSKEKIDPKKRILEICSLLPTGEISVEVTEKEPQAVYKQAKRIAQLAENILVKIPCHKDYYAVIKQLVDEGVKLNITLVFSLIQGVMMSKLGVFYISPFIGRWDDIDVNGVHILQEMRQVIYQYGFDTGILAASLRHVRHLHDALMVGADAATVPSAVLEQALEHPLTDRGIAKFDADWQKLGIKQFP